MDTTTQDLLNVAGVMISAALLVASIGGLVWLFINATVKKVAPVALLLAGFCLEVYFFKQPYVQVGLQIYPNDVVSVIVLLAAIVGFTYRPLPVYSGAFQLWLAFGAAIIMSFVVGLNEYGRNAGTEVRPFFYMWVAGLYCCVADFDEADLRRIARWCMWAAYALIAIAIYYWIAVRLGFVNRQELFEEPDTAVFRPVGSHGTFFVAAIALFHVMAWLRGTGTRLSGLHAVLFIGFVVVMQHRSVWIAAAVGLLWVLMLERRHLPRRFGLLLAFVLSIIFFGAIAAAFGTFDDLARQLTASTLSMTDSGGTFAARFDGWVRLLDAWTDATTMTLVFGFPFGHGYTRLYNGVVIDFAPHNYFIDLMLRVGVVGAILFVLPTLMATVHGLRTKTNSEFDYLLSRGLGVGLLAAFVYFIAYPSYYIIGGATGVALAHLIRRRQMHGTHRRSPFEAMHRVLPSRAMGWRTER